MQSYRVLKAAGWVGRPATKPDIKVEGSSVYVSWNGATEVAEWELFAGSSPSTLQSVGRAPRRGFETMMLAPRVPRYVQVRARNRAGEVLSTSAPTRVRGS